MAKKNFETINTGSRVISALEKSTAQAGRQATAPIQEQEERRARGNTQGRKGCKKDRYNLGVTTENRKYIEVMSGLRGQSMSNFINDVIEQHRLDNLETYEQATQLAERLKHGKTKNTRGARG